MKTLPSQHSWGALVAIALAVASVCGHAQSIPHSMLEVRQAAQEYRKSDDKEAADNAAAAATTTISVATLAAHASTAGSTYVADYLAARSHFSSALEARRQELDAHPSHDTELAELQQQWLSKWQSKLDCLEAGAPAADASQATVQAWYTNTATILAPLTTSLTPVAAVVASPAVPAVAAVPAFVPTAPPANKAVLQNEVHALDANLTGCPVVKDDEEDANVVFVRGLGQALYTGSRLVPAVTLLADATHFQTSSHSAFIGGLEITGLSTDALKQIDSVAVRRNLLYPELSTFGAGLTLGICKHNVKDHNYTHSFIGVLWRGSYLLKNLRDPKATTSDTRQVGTDHLLSSLTVEYVVPKLNLSFFGSYNYQEVVGGREAFHRILDTSISSFNYLGWGVRGKLNVGSSKGIKNQQNINLEIGFIQLTDRMQQLLQITDPLIPTIRVGFTHRIFDNLKPQSP